MTESRNVAKRIAAPARVRIAGNAIQLDEHSVPFVLRRSKRARRLSLRIDAPAGAVTLVLPFRAAAGEGLSFLNDNAGWIRKRLSALPAAVPFADGATIPLKGVAHQIRHQPGARGTVWLEGGAINVAGRAEHLARRLRDWLAGLARAELTERAARMAARIDRRVRRVTVRDSRTRWGSCAASGSLSFSWRLLLAPEFVIDYMVAHEVAHLCHMNHGARFWSLVSRLAPEAEAAKRWLRRHGAALHRYG